MSERWWWPLRIHVSLSIEVSGADEAVRESDLGAVAEAAAETMTPELHMGFRPNEGGADE